MSKLAFKMRSGGKTSYAKGGKTIGPSHNEGGIETLDESGDAVAEIEGGERVFSVEHTQEIETKAEEISSFLKNEDDDTANELATVLGYRVVEMIAEQEKINPS